MRRSWLTTVLLLALCGAVFAVHGRIEIRSRAALGEPFVPRPEVARLSSLGFRTALSDYYWLQAVQVVGAATQPAAQATLLGRFIDVVTMVDPWVGHPYRFAAVWLTGSEEEVRHANMLLRRSLSFHPEEWRNRFYLGFNHFYYLEDNDEAAHWIEEAAHMEGSPRYLLGLAARLRAGQGGLDVSEDMIREIWAATTDPYEKAEYAKMLDEIQTERAARRIDRARIRYRRAFGRDIERVEDLLRSEPPMLERLPEEVHGFEWLVDEDTGEVVSSFYGSRYRPHTDHDVRAELDGWRVERQPGDEGGES